MRVPRRVPSPPVIRALVRENPDIALVGEGLMREPDPGAALRALLA